MAVLGAIFGRMDFQAYERRRKALHLFKILSQGDQAYRDGRYVGHAEVQRRFRRKLTSLQGHV